VPPERIEVELGVTDKLKSGAVTSRVTLTLFANSSVPVPVIVTVELLAELPNGVVTVSVELPGTLIETGVNKGVIPDGRPVAAKLMEPLKPYSAAAFTVYAAVPPGFTEAVLGAADNVK
jgi:hypothetical protein